MITVKQIADLYGECIEVYSLRHGWLVKRVDGIIIRQAENYAKKIPNEETRARLLGYRYRLLNKK